MNKPILNNETIGVEVNWPQQEAQHLSVAAFNILLQHNQCRKKGEMLVRWFKYMAICSSYAEFKDALITSPNCLKYIIKQAYTIPGNSGRLLRRFCNGFVQHNKVRA